MSVLIRLVNIAALVINDIYKSGEEDKKHREAGTGPYSPEAIAIKKQENERREAEVEVEAAKAKLTTEKAIAERIDWERAMTKAFTVRPIAERDRDEVRISDLEARACAIATQSNKSETAKHEQAAKLFGAAREFRVGIGEDPTDPAFAYGERMKYNNAMYFIQQSLGVDGCFRNFKAGMLLMHQEKYEELKFDSTMETETKEIRRLDYLWPSK